MSESLERSCEVCGVLLVAAPGGEGLLACPRCADVHVSFDASIVSLAGLSDAGDPSGPIPPRIEIPAEIHRRYALGRVLGRGGMGIVVYATERDTNRPVAIKFLTREDDEAALARFLREGELLREIRHPNVLPVLDVGATGRYPYLVCQVITGGNLRELLDREHRLSPRVAVSHACAVASGLGAIHERGIIHRDVKPQNILFDAEGRPLVADLGLAKVWGPDNQHLTKTGALLGTPKYMSPEQANGEPVGPTADVYGLALVVYEMLAGRAPFEDPSVFLLLMDQINKPPPPLKDLAPDVPEPLADVIHRALSKRPDERPQSIDAFARELKRALTPSPSRARGLHRIPASTGGARTTADPVTPARPSPVPTPAAPAPPAGRESETNARALGFAGAITLAALVAISTAFVQRDPPPLKPVDRPTTSRRRPAAIVEAHPQLVIARVTPAASASPKPAASASMTPGRPPATAATLAPASPSATTVTLAPAPPSPGPVSPTGPLRLAWRLPPDPFQHPAPLAALTCASGVAISASRDGLVSWWAPDGSRQRIARLKFGPPAALALAAHAPRAATVSDDGTLRVWDLGADATRPVLELAGLPARDVALTPSGDAVAVLSPGGDVTLCAVGRPPKPLAGARGTQRLAFTRSGDRLITRQGVAGLQVWHTATGALARLIATDAPDGPLWASDDRVLLFAGGVHAWSLTSGERLASGWSPGTDTRTLALSADGTTLFAATGAGVRRFDLASGAPLDPLDGSLPDATWIAASADGKLVATGAPDGAITLGDPAARQAGAMRPPGLRQRIALNPDGATLILATSRTLALGDVQARTLALERPLFAAEPGAPPVALVAGPGWVHAASSRSVVRRVLARDGSEIAADLPDPRPITALAAATDGRAVAAGCLDGNIWLWSDWVSGPRPRAVAQLAPGTVEALAFDATSSRVAAAGSPSGFLELYDVATGRMASELHTANELNHVSLSAPLALVATASAARRQIALWRADGTQAAIFSARAADRGTLAVTSRSEVLWSDPRGEVHRFAPAEGPLPPLPAEGGVVTQIAVSADASTLATLATDGTVSVWSTR